MTAHPRLFATAKKFAVLADRSATDRVTGQLAALVRRRAESAVAAPPVEYVDTGSFLLWAVREGQARILSTAMTYRLTGERQFLDRARAELLALCALPDWCPRHFLDVGEAALSAGVGLDWLHDELSAGDRATIARAIVDKALAPSLQVAETGTWVGAEFNWNPVCHGGLTAGALAIAEREPDLARQVVDRAVRNLPHAARAYEPDGTYPEGPSYWSYGTTFYVLAIEALRSAFGAGGRIEPLPGFLASADFVAQMKGPTGEEFNFADYHRRSPPEPVMLWFARELRRPDIAGEELAAIERLHAATVDDGAGGPPVPHGEAGRSLPFGLLWWDPSLAGLPPAPPRPRSWVGGGALPVAVFRSAWDDPRATYVAVKGGTANGSHAHMDVGSFVLEADGVRWAIDLGTESYPTMRAAKIDLWNYAQYSTRWSTFRCGPEAHNVLRFDGARPVADARAGIEQLAADDHGAAGATVDLRAVYAAQAVDVRRTVRLHPDRSVSIVDEWTAGARAVDATWQWLTRAAVEVTPTGATLRQSGATLHLNVDGPPGTTVVVEDVSAPRGPQDSPNPGVSRIVVRAPTPATKGRRLVVRASPGRR